MQPKPNRLMQVYTMQNDFLHHRQKIMGVQRRNIANEVKKSNLSQMDMVNSFRKNWAKAAKFRSSERQRQINHENNLLHECLQKQYNRTKSMIKPQKLEETIRSNSSTSRISLRSSLSKSRLIKEQNLRLMKKIKGMESSLAKKKMDSEYLKTRETKKRLEVYSSENRDKIISSLKKMKMEPVVSFPRVRSKFQTIK